ncbi:ApeA N-terminal domain 1-containing protein [Catellatospora vulcania]|uniref:ApeA N-terminal domain 1-containing protein n=1 Tax=Catellatospora vulcania TaxID=1460450 RepID=UPI0012D3903A|nr:HEPN domain-containing protein [Catellatospora vulcania]
MKDLSTKGYFWHPGLPERRVPGWIDFTSGSGGTLHLIGHLDAPGGISFGAGEVVPRIVGEGDNGLTLENCYRTSRRVGSGLNEETYRFGMMFEGAFRFEEEEEILLDQLLVEMRHLLAWSGRHNLNEVEIRSPDNKTAGWTTSVEVLPDVSVEIESGVRMSLRHSPRIEGGKYARTLSQRGFMHLELDSPQELATITAYAASIQDLVSMATNRIAEFDSFRVSNPEFVRNKSAQNASGIREYLHLHVEWIAREESDKPLRVLVPFEDIGGLDGVAVWLRKIAPFRDLVSRVMATRYNKTMYADDRFFNRAAALEGLHRHLYPRRRGANGGKPTFAERLQDLATTAGDPFAHLVEDVDEWVRKVTRGRNDHAHHLRNAVQTTGATHHFLADSAYWLFIMCVFRECNYGGNVFDAIEASAEFKHLHLSLKAI